MVVIQVKRTETDGYLYECSIADSNDAVVRELVRPPTWRLSSPANDGNTDGASFAVPDPQLQGQDSKIIRRPGRISESWPIET